MSRPTEGEVPRHVAANWPLVAPPLLPWYVTPNPHYIIINYLLYPSLGEDPSSVQAGSSHGPLFKFFLLQVRFH